MFRGFRVKIIVLGVRSIKCRNRNVSQEGKNNVIKVKFPSRYRGGLSVLACLKAIMLISTKKETRIFYFEIFKISQIVFGWFVDLVLNFW